MTSEQERWREKIRELSNEDVASDTFSDTFNVVDLFTEVCGIKEPAVANDMQRIVSHVLLTPSMFLDWEAVPPGTRGPTNAQYDTWRSAVDSSVQNAPVSPGAVMACLLEANRLRMVHRLAMIRAADPQAKGVAMRDRHIHRASIGLRFALDALQESMPQLHRLMALAIEEYILDLRVRTEGSLLQNSEGMVYVAMSELMEMEGGNYCPPSQLGSESTLWLEGQLQYRYQPWWLAGETFAGHDHEQVHQQEKQHWAEICRRLREQGHDTSAIEDHIQR